MEFSDSQMQAINDVVDWYVNPDSPQVFKLFGYAGTGKTTISKHIADELGYCKILFGAFTGKAALVMRQMGCSGATTIHSLIYFVKEKSKLQLKFLQSDLKEAQEELLGEPGSAENTKSLRDKIISLQDQIASEEKNLKGPAFSINPECELAFTDLLIVDEGSTINERLAVDLLSFGKKVLVMGDPKQLPPPYGTAFFMHDPDVLLTEVHRQAKGNPIIKMATQIRNGEGLDLGCYGESHVFKDRKEMKESLLSFDQIIVGTNKTRHYLNNKLRKAKGFTSDYPEVGDKLVCTKNNHDLGLLNGSIWMVDKVESVNPFQCELAITSSENQSLTIKVHSARFVGGEVDHWAIKDAESFEYGYAITAHKAQGSQWENILIVFDGRWTGEQKEQWLYTAVTRAINRVVLCK